jgi:biotin operon repressor
MSLPLANEAVGALNPDDWVSQSEAAEMRGITRQAVHQLARKGRFRTRKVAGRTLLHRDDVLSYEVSKGGRPPNDKE